MIFGHFWKTLVILFVDPLLTGFCGLHFLSSEGCSSGVEGDRDISLEDSGECDALGDGIDTSILSLPT
jgi:hypothetical protein